MAQLGDYRDKLNAALTSNTAKKTVTSQRDCDTLWGLPMAAWTCVSGDPNVVP